MIEQGADCEVTVGRSAGGCVRTEKKCPETGNGRYDDTRKSKSPYPANLDHRLF